MSRQAQSAFGRAVDRVEETVITVLLGVMTLLTFANVVARYIFNTNILWALEVTVFLFAWLVLLGASYAVKHSIHIGVDVMIRALPKGTQRMISLIAAAACILFALLMLKGAWDYWYPFATKRAFLETDDVPMPEFLQFLADWLNEGERYEKLPRFIPYFVLPLSMALLTWRFVQAGWDILTGKRELLIAGHEAEAALIDEVTDDLSHRPDRKD
ncbi:MAG: TRAP transporter small permease [Kiloniellales bacterium]|nr:TRAP transporter small permease [Kiloniellales bacterium]